MTAARSVLAAVARGVQTCKTEDVSGGGQVELRFAPSGEVMSAKIRTGSLFEGTPTGRCVEERFRTARVPPFTGSPVPVTKSFTIE